MRMFPRSLSENAISKSTLSAQIHRYFPKTMLAGSEDSDIKHMAVLVFGKCLDFNQVSVDSESPILGQAPDMVDTRNTLISLDLKICVNHKILWLADSQILTCVNHTI